MSGCPFAPVYAFDEYRRSFDVVARVLEQYRRDVAAYVKWRKEAS